HVEDAQNAHFFGDFVTSRGRLRASNLVARVGPMPGSSRSALYNVRTGTNRGSSTRCPSTIRDLRSEEGVRQGPDLRALSVQRHWVITPALCGAFRSSRAGPRAARRRE